ncbi:rabGAP/TBC domain-containing protein isoform X2 [Carex rostrata]
MQEPEFHDLSDDSDYAAASQHQSSNSIMRSDSIKSGVSEPSGSEIVFYKDNVTIHPKQYTSDRISGRLRLIKQSSDLLLSWVPYKPSELGTDCLGRSDPEAADKDRNLYAIKASLTDVRSIRRHTPPLGWQYIIVVLSSGLAYPPLYFYSGGVREFITTLKQHVFIIRSSEDPNVFLVNDFQDPLQKSLSSLELPGLASFKSSTVSLDNSDYDQDNGSVQNSSRPSNKNKQGDLSMQVLEKFSLVTRFARETTSSLFRENHGNQYPYEKFLEKHKPALNNKEESKHEQELTSQESSSVASDVSENGVASDVLDFSHASDVSKFDRLPLVWGKQRESPLGVEEWTSFLDNDGRVMDSKALRKRVFYGGVEPELRKEVWKFLLGFYEYHSTYAEREFLSYEKEQEYQTVKKQWQSISSTQAKRFTKYRERKGLIDKDVVRTDRSVPFYEGDDNRNVVILRDILLTYSFFNFDLGYCQGMSDLLSPILYVMENESDAFWCFVSLMERLGPNFNRDQSGMHSQLLALSKLVELLDGPLQNYLKQADCLNYFFCFRWILIQFKREFEFDEIMRLWEVLWTHYLSEHFHLYMCIAILKRYRGRIIGEQMDFDTLLKFINELSGHIDLEQSLRDAEALCVIGGENGAALIPPGTPPSLPIETDAGLYVLDDEVL